MDANGFKKLITSLGLTQAQASGKIGVSTAYLKKVCSGSRPIPQVWLDALQSANGPIPVAPHQNTTPTPKVSEARLQTEAEASVPICHPTIDRDKKLEEWLTITNKSPMSIKDRAELFMSLLGAKRLPSASGALVLDCVRSAAGIMTEFLLKSAQPGNPEFDIMQDGYARGFAGDTVMMRGSHRTAHALRRILEKESNAQNARFPGMAHLPGCYQITASGKVEANGKEVKFNRSPDFGKTVSK